MTVDCGKRKHPPDATYFVVSLISIKSSTEVKVWRLILTWPHLMVFFAKIVLASALELSLHVDFFKEFITIQNFYILWLIYPISWYSLNNGDTRLDWAVIVHLFIFIEVILLYDVRSMNCSCHTSPPKTYHFTVGQEFWAGIQVYCDDYIIWDPRVSSTPETLKSE